MDELGRPRAKPEYVRFEPKTASPPPASPSAAPQKATPALAASPGATTPTRGMFWPLCIAGALLVAIVGGVVWNVRHQPDPNYVRARDRVARYELGRDPAALNYHNQVYTTALEELGLVAPDSVSAEPARALAKDIEDRRATFRERLQASAVRREANRERKTERERVHGEHVAQTLANPRTEYPECKD